MGTKDKKFYQICLSGKGLFKKHCATMAKSYTKFTHYSTFYMHAQTNTTFCIDKKDLHQTNTIELAAPNAAVLGENQLLLQVEKFALTANNITYAVVGNDFGYWHFFPAPEANQGIMPVWGFARVVASNHPEILVGARYYGYYPTAQYLVVTAGKARPGSFVDVSAHRTQLPAVYNFYNEAGADAHFTASDEGLQMLFRPLFATSFLLDDFLFDNHFFNASQIILTSASSKTAFALAHLLKRRKQQNSENWQIIGLTSAGNRDFVQQLGCYDQVLTYAEIAKLPKADSCVVDFMGNGELLQNLQQSLGEQLRYCCLVGVVDWENRQTENTQPIGKFFFAPTQIQKRFAEWGADGYNQRLGEAWADFVSHTWIEVETHQGFEALSKLYAQTLQGQVYPKKGIIISVHQA